MLEPLILAEGAVSWTMYEFLNLLVHQVCLSEIFRFYEDFIKH